MAELNRSLPEKPEPPLDTRAKRGLLCPIPKKGLTFVSPQYIILLVTQRGDAMSPRTGRPTTDPKNHETRIRMSDEDVRLLEICCQKTGLSKAEVIRQGIREVYRKVAEK